MKGCIDTNNHWWAQYEWYMTWLNPASNSLNSLNRYTFETFYYGKGLFWLPWWIIAYLNIRLWTCWMSERTGCFKDESECLVNLILFNTQEHLVRQPQFVQRQVTQQDNWVKSACLHLWPYKWLISHLLGCPNTNIVIYINTVLLVFKIGYF